jgi:hypothetical protein
MYYIVGHTCANSLYVHGALQYQVLATDMHDGYARRKMHDGCTMLN